MLPPALSRHSVVHKVYKTSQGRPHTLRLALIICRRQPIGSRQSTIDGVLCSLAPHYPSTVPAHCLATGARLSSDGLTRSTAPTGAATDDCDVHARVDEQPPENVTSRQRMISAVTLRVRPKKNEKKKKGGGGVLIMTWFDPTDT